MHESAQKPPLRRGWTTGACAAGAARAAFTALVTGAFPDPVEVVLPGGQRPFFALAATKQGEGWASASIIKDAGDDPDVTHGALICALVRRGTPGSGVTFRAGPGVGVVTKPGLPIPPGEPAINPVPQRMMRATIAEAASLHGANGDADIEISVPHGEEMAVKTMNPRLGIIGGISILGTTGIVIPYSCSAWIHAIHSGIDVARAEGLTHVAGATGSTSENAIRKMHALPESALIDMGDFAGGMLKYLRRHPVHHVTIAGGFAKMTKLAQGLLDLHSRAGAVDLGFLAGLAAAAHARPDTVAQIRNANTATHALEIAAAHGIDLAGAVAAHAWQTAAKALDGSDAMLEIAVFGRDGQWLAQTPFCPVG